MGTEMKEETEDDYMTMSFDEPQAKHESSVQRRARIKKEAETRAHPKSKEEQTEFEVKLREDGLDKKIDRSSRGFKLLQKLGYKPGTALGAEKGNSSKDARLEPIAIEVKEDRSGIGHSTEKKRQIREQMEFDVKRVKTSESDFRQRASSENASQRNEHLWRSAMSTLERMEEDYNDESPIDNEHLIEDGVLANSGPRVGGNDKTCRPWQDVNILYRSLVRSRVEDQEHKDSRSGLSKALRHMLDENADDKLLWYEGEVPEDDEELARFEALAPEVRLQNVVSFLRDKYFYCFWCKLRYPDSEMEGCPGSSEDAHD